MLIFAKHSRGQRMFYFGYEIKWYQSKSGAGKGIIENLLQAITEL
jgi:hypothetical protein